MVNVSDGLETNFNLENYKVLFTDFDGVLTDNNVSVDGNGLESVNCSRSDGLSFDYLNNINFSTYIISSERNSVVSARAHKLGVTCLQSVENKVSTIKSIVAEINCSQNQVIYVGNDINDLGAILYSGLSFCPLDSHELVKQHSDIILDTLGGQGIFREILEVWFKVNLTEKFLKEF